jgi:glycosyltransferase involved in cell wall biosynthesis
MTKHISVCMTTYNGSQFIKEQIDSILKQLGTEDEVIITDDHSTDSTCQIIQEYQDKRIKFFKNPQRLGHVQNFSKSISLATGEYIFLSDQDDIWSESRVAKMLNLIKDAAPNTLVIGDFLEISSQGDPLSENKSLGETPAIRWIALSNIFLGRAKYFGCAYLFRSEFKKIILPIPAPIESHDIWIAMNACIHGKIVHCQEPTLYRRIHGNNLTPNRRRGLYKIVKSRLIYFWYLFGRLARPHV